MLLIDSRNEAARKFIGSSLIPDTSLSSSANHLSATNRPLISDLLRHAIACPAVVFDRDWFPTNRIAIATAVNNSMEVLNVLVSGLRSHRDVDLVPGCKFDSAGITGICVTKHAHSRIARENAFEPSLGVFGP